VCRNERDRGAKIERFLHDRAKMREGESVGEVESSGRDCVGDSRPHITKVSICTDDK